METFFTVLLGVGLGYGIIGFFIGDLLGGDDVDIGATFPLKPVVIATFITVLGGAGLILIRNILLIAAISLAVLIAAVFAFLIYRFLVVPLSKAQNTTAIEIQSLIGNRAKVTEKIPQGNYGKITYVVNDSTYNAPAKSEDGKEIARGSYVEIVYIESNTYFVRPVEG